VIVPVECIDDLALVASEELHDFIKLVLVLRSISLVTCCSAAALVLIISITLMSDSCGDRWDTVYRCMQDVW
jgi:hypothetical protein